MKNPLRETPGKGDKPRNCNNPKFRNNYSMINWKNTDSLIEKLSIQAREINRKNTEKIKEFFKNEKPFSIEELNAEPIKYRINNLSKINWKKKKK